MKSRQRQPSGIPQGGEFKNEHKGFDADDLVAPPAVPVPNGIGEHNYFMGTVADWRECEQPDRKPDYRSGSGSQYWYTENGVIRSSNHWGEGVASCDWYLDGEEIWGGSQWYCGYAAYMDFRLKEREVTVYDSSGTVDFDKLGEPVSRNRSDWLGCEYAIYKINPEMMADGFVSIGGKKEAFRGQYPMSVEL